MERVGGFEALSSFGKSWKQGKCIRCTPGNGIFSWFTFCAMFSLKHRGDWISPENSLNSQIYSRNFKLKHFFSAPPMSDDHAHQRQTSTSPRRWLIWKSQSTRLQQRHRSIYRDANIQPAFAWIIFSRLALSAVCSSMVSGWWRCFRCTSLCDVVEGRDELAKSTMFSVIWWQILPLSNAPVPSMHLRRS